MLRIALPLLLAVSAPAAALDLPALIECRQGVAEQAALATLLADPLRAVAHGLQPLPQGNQFMSEYRHGVSEMSPDGRCAVWRAT